MAIKRLGIAGTVVLLGILIYGTVAIAMGAGLIAHHRATGARENTMTIGKNTAPPHAAANAMVDLQGSAVQGSAPAYNGSSGATASSLAYPYPGFGAFEPGPPPNFSGTSGDGLTAWGVAFRQTPDTNAKVDAALIKSAYQDAQKRAQDLAAATGISLGKLVAMSDYTNAQPYFDKACLVQGGGAVPPGKPVMPPSGAPGGGSSSNGSTSSGTVIAEPAPAIAPAPCAQSRYLVAWVTVRYAIA
jgi:hypothetical protein